MTQPLTKDELWLLDEKVAKGEIVKLWLVSDFSEAQIMKICAAPANLLYVDDDPSPLRNILLSGIHFPLFDNYWHAYAYKLKKNSGEK
jgi:hypothetical protein